MGNINVLSFEVANLIAAGEVVDRPASVLKELLENAIDAGAHSITAEVRHGGVSLIRVSDDGCGMAPEDLPLSIRRHATSKIHEASDLSAIGTLGFRGEALAAISAVSDIRIISRPRGAMAGTILSATGGRVTDISEVGCAEGTTVLVENLFAAVPARRKFLKKDVTEAMAAAAVCEKIAMSRPDIAFTFTVDGKERFSTAGDGNLKGTLYALLGRDFAARLLPVASDGAVSLSGFVGTPDNGRNNRNWQNVFINGRYIKSKTVTAALEKAYTSYMAPERFPACALFLTIRPDAVDVNVHPAKLEVKFSDERLIFETVYYAVRSALLQDESRPELTIPAARPAARDVRAAFVPVGAREKVTQFAVDLAPAPTVPAAEAVRPETAAPDAPAPAVSVPPRPAPANSVRAMMEAMRAGIAHTDEGAPPPPPARMACASPAEPLRDTPAPDTTPAPAPEAVPSRTDAAPAGMPAESAPSPAPAVTDRPPYRLIGEAFRCYLIVERENELLLIDKHAAHERILFEGLRAEQQKDGRVASQSVMPELEVPLSPVAFAAAEEHRAELENVGFSFRLEEGKCRAYLSALPHCIGTGEGSALFARMADELAEGSGDPAVTEAMRRERTLYQVACKAAIKGGRVYDDAPITWLLDRVMALPDVTVCPHGRPIAVRLTKNQLDRQFDRIM